MRKENETSTFGTVVPNHKELKIGTLKGILELAKVSEEEFSKEQAKILDELIDKIGVQERM